MGKINILGASSMIVGVGITLAGTFLPETQWVSIECARRITIMGFVFIGFGIVFFVVSLIKTFRTRNKLEIQTQLDSLITDIIAYQGTIPPRPIPYTTDDSSKMLEYHNKYLQDLNEYNGKLSADFFSKFNTRFANIVIQLHDLSIITDLEYNDAKAAYNSVYMAYGAMPALLSHLQKYKSRLDERAEKFRSK